MLWQLKIKHTCFDLLATKGKRQALGRLLQWKSGSDPLVPLLASGDRPFFHVGSDLSQIVPLVRIAGFYPVDRSTVRIAGFTLSIVPQFGSRGFTLSIVLVPPLVRNGSHLHVVRRADVEFVFGVRSY